MLAVCLYHKENLRHREDVDDEADPPVRVDLHGALLEVRLRGRRGGREREVGEVKRERR